MIKANNDKGNYNDGDNNDNNKDNVDDNNTIFQNRISMNKDGNLTNEFNCFSSRYMSEYKFNIFYASK